MDFAYNIILFLCTVLPIVWTYQLITKVKFDKVSILSIFILYLISLLPRGLFLPFLFIGFYIYSRRKRIPSSLAIFYTLYSVFWITLLSVAIEASFTFLFEDFTDRYTNWIHYSSFISAALMNFGVMRLFKIDFVLLNKKDKYIRKNIIKLSNQIMLFCIFILFLWIIVAETFAYSETYAIFGGVYFSLLTSMYFIFMGILSMKIKNYLMIVIEREKDQRYQELEKYTEDVEVMQKELAGFKHDMKNIWISFSEVIRSKDQDFIEKTFNEIKEKLEIQVAEVDKVSNDLAHMKETVTKGLLHQKHSLAREKKLNMKIDIKNEINSIPMEMLDFVRVLGILLDNAIEEADMSRRKEVIIGFVQRNDKLIIEIINHTDKENIPVSKIFRDGYTTKMNKGENRGKGLAIVSNIVKDTPQLALHTRHQSGQFYQILEIWNKL